MGGLDIRAIDVSPLPKKPFPTVSQAFRIHVSEEAFDTATERGAADLTREIGGILVGELNRDEGGPYVRVETTIDALHAEEKGTELTFTHATWDHVHQEMDSKHKGKQIVGWYHTHPGFGVFLSERDEFIHKSFFNSPHQIALVHDPKSRETGVFAWREGEPVRCRRFWIAEREILWDGPRPSPMASRPEKEERREPAMTRAAPAEPPQDLDTGTLIIGAVFLLILGGVAGWFFGGMRGQSAIKDIELELSRAHLSGAHETARLVNTDMLGILRAFVNGEAARKPLADALADLEKGLAEFGKEGREPQARLKFENARRRIQTHLSLVTRAENSLARLESLGRIGQIDTRELAQGITMLQSRLGQLYLEMSQLAASGGDKRLARRLLQTAAQFDPRSGGVYEEAMKAFGPEENK